jgi:hypothetical protein
VDQENRDVLTDAPDKVGGAQHVGNVSSDAVPQVGAFDVGIGRPDETEREEVLVAGTAKYFQREHVTELRLTEGPGSTLSLSHRSPHARREVHIGGRVYHAQRWVPPALLPTRMGRGRQASFIP